MATPTAAAAAAAAPSTGGQPPKDSAESTPAVEAPKKLSNAELKAQKQAKKANRRAAAVAAKEANPGAGSAPAQGAQATGDGKASKPKSKQEQSGSSGGASAAAVRPSVGRRPSAGGGQRPAGVAPEKQKEEDPRGGIPECFSHLPMARRTTLAQADKDVHPAILAIGQQMATFTLRDPMARAEATVQGFKQVRCWWDQ